MNKGNYGYPKNRTYPKFPDSASYALTASYFSGTVVSSSFSSTASYLLGSITSASFSSTASYIKNAQTSSYLLTSLNGLLKGNGSNITLASASTDYIAGGLGLADYMTYYNGVGSITGSSAFQYINKRLIFVDSDYVNGIGFGASTSPYSGVGSLKGGAGFFMGTGCINNLTVSNALTKTNSALDKAHFFYTRYDRGLEFHTGITGSPGDDISDTANLRMIINSDGNIGIGTDSPAKKIEIYGNDAILRFRPVANNNFVGTEWQTDGGAVTWASIIGNANTGEFRHYGYSSTYQTFYANGAEYLRLNVDGTFKVYSDLILSSSLLSNQNGTTISGSNIIASKLTGSYTSAFYNYTAISSSNARSGQIMSVWSGSVINYTEVSTTDIGSTSGLILSASLNGDNIQLIAKTTTAGWVVKSLASYL